MFVFVPAGLAGLGLVGVARHRGVFLNLLWQPVLRRVGTEGGLQRGARGMSRKSAGDRLVNNRGRVLASRLPGGVVMRERAHPVNCAGHCAAKYETRYESRGRGRRLSASLSASRHVKSRASFDFGTASFSARQPTHGLRCVNLGCRPLRHVLESAQDAWLLARRANADGK